LSNYETFRFLYPPRPKRVILESQLAQFEAAGFWAQVKKEGTHNVLAISPDRTVIAMQRRGVPHKLWTPREHTVAPFLGLPGGWYVFSSELLHTKLSGTQVPRDTNYIHDILVADSQTLYGMSFQDRQALLARLFNAPQQPVSASGSHWLLDGHTWLAQNHHRGFTRLYQGLTRPEDEGLVLKRPNAVLAPCVTASANVSWLYKIRRPKKG
jgi:hypothetical protein